MGQRPSALAPLQYGTYRALWATILVAYTGGFVQSMAAGWIMTTLTTSTVVVALVQAATTLPIMLFSLPAGVLADNFERRITILIAQAMMATASAVLLLCGLFDVMSPWILLVMTFVVGCGWALHSPSWDASMRDLVPKEVLPDAVTLNSMAYNSMRSIGPAIGGIIVATAGAAAAFAISAVSYLPIIVGLLMWKPQRQAAMLPRQSFVESMISGLRFAWVSPTILRVISRTFMFGCSASGLMALLPVMVSREMGSGALTYGTLLGCFGMGAIVGGLSSAHWRRYLGNEAILRSTTAGLALGGLGLAGSPDLVLAHVLLVPAGACWVVAMSLMSATVQLSAPRWVAGRTMALYHTATYGGMAIGALVWGAVADLAGVWISLATASASLFLTVLIGLRYPLTKFDAQAMEIFDQVSQTGAAAVSDGE